MNARFERNSISDELLLAVRAAKASADRMRCFMVRVGSEGDG